MENVLINFTSDPQGLEPGKQGLEDILEADKAIADQAKKTMDAYNKRDKAIGEGSKASKKSIDELANSVKNLDKSLVGGIGGKALSELRASIKLTDTQWKEFYKNIVKNAKVELVSATQKEDIEQLNQLIHGAEAALDAMAKKEELVNTISKSMKQELRQLKQELQQLEDQGLENSAQFEQMAVRAGKLQDQIGDTDARIKALSSDTFVFDALISGITGLTGAFAAAQGVAALFGEENEDIQRALLKVNAAMSILQGLQAVQNVLQKQSAASIAVDLVLRRNQTAATTAQTLATTAQTGATVAATTAQKGLNLAFLASPTGLLLTGIAAITAALFAFGGASQSAKDDTDKLNESLQRQNDLLNDLTGDSFSAKLERYRLRLKGASEQELFKFDVKEEERKLEEIKKVQQNALKERGDFEARNRKIFTELEEQFGAGTVKINKKTKEELEKQGKIYNEKVVSANEAVAKQQEKILLMQAEQDVKVYEEALDKKKKLDEENSEKAKELREKRRKDEYEADLAAARSAVARTEAKIIQSKKGSEEELNLRLKLLDQQYYAEILVRGRTVGELEKIDAQYYKDRQDLVAQYNRKEAEDAINTRIARLNSVLSLTENNNERIKAKKDLIDAEADLEAISIRQSEANEELRRTRIKAVYDKALADKRQLEQDKIKAEIDSLLQSQLSAIDRERSKLRRDNATNLDSDRVFNEELSLEERIIAAKRVSNFNLLAAKAIDNAEFRRRENELDNQQDEIEIRREQRKQDKINQIRNLAIQAAQNMVQAFFNISSRGYEKEMEQVKELFDQKKISQTEYDNRVRQLRRKQAQDEKAQAIFNMLLQQGPVILEGFKKGGFAGIAAAFTLFFSMLSAVTSTEVPQFRTGKVKIDGPGTDTSDSIFARISRNESVINAASTKKHEEALRAINEDRYDAHLMNYELPRLYQNMNATQGPVFSERAYNAAGGIDYQRMAEAFAEELANNPQTSLAIDEDGFTLRIQKGNQITEYKNKKLTT